MGSSPKQVFAWAQVLTCGFKSQSEVNSFNVNLTGKDLNVGKD